MTDHSSKARMSPGKPLLTTPAPVLILQFNHYALTIMTTAQDKTINSVLSSAAVEKSLPNSNYKKLVS